MMYAIIFDISSSSYLYIPLLIPEQELHLYSAGSIYLRKTDDSDIILYGDGPLFSVIDELCYVLEEVIKGTLELHHRYREKGIGYMCNEHIWNKLESSDENNGLWAGTRYKLWGTGKGNSSTWLYTIDGKIFLDVSPYAPYAPWDFDNEQEEQKYRSAGYEEYMKTYKPIAIFELSRETVQQWFDYSKSILKTMQKNSE